MMAARTTPAVDPHVQRLIAEVGHMATKQSDYATVLQAMQIDMRHVVKNMEALTEVAKEQVLLTAKMGTLTESIDRAYKTIDGHKDELARAITKLSETLDKDRDSAKAIAETVTGYKAQLKVLYGIGGVVITLLAVIASMTVRSIEKDVVGNRASVVEIANDVKVLEAKEERLRIESKLEVAEHERRLSRLEAKGDEVAP